VDSKSLTPDQIAKLLKTTRRMSRWLECFTGRMHQRHFPHTDPVKLVGEDALKAVAPLRDGISI
jgi:hypothetical protein